MGAEVAAYLTVFKYAGEGLVAYCIFGVVATAASRLVPRMRHWYSTLWRVWIFATLGGVLAMATTVMLEIYDARHPAPWDAPLHIFTLLSPMIGLIVGVICGTIVGVYLAQRKRARGGRPQPTKSL